MVVIGIATFLLLAIVVYLIAAPPLGPDPAEEPLGTAALEARKQQLLSDIRELDADLATGKLDDEDHRRFRARALAEAADTMRRLDGLEKAGIGPTETTVEGPDALEDLIAARKLTLEVYGCPGCEGVVDPDDAFCRRCGESLTTGAVR
jgi:hypothetical protein